MTIPEEDGKRGWNILWKFIGHRWALPYFLYGVEQFIIHPSPQAQVNPKGFIEDVVELVVEIEKQTSMWKVKR